MTCVPRSVWLMQGYDIGYEGKPAVVPSFAELPATFRESAAASWLDGYSLGNAHWREEQREGGGWQDISTAPKDGTPLLLLARAKNATAEALVIGWYIALGDLGWIECCFTPNSPVGIVPSQWKPLRPPGWRSR